MFEVSRRCVWIRALQRTNSRDHTTPPVIFYCRKIDENVIFGVFRYKMNVNIGDHSELCAALQRVSVRVVKPRRVQMKGLSLVFKRARKKYEVRLPFQRRGGKVW